MNIEELRKEIEKELVNEYSLTELLEVSNKYKHPYPKRLRKPIMPRNANSDEAKQYAQDLYHYECNEKIYLEERDFARDRECQINTIIKEKIKIICGLNDVVPQQYRDKVFNKAWQDGHSSGWHGVYNELVDLVYIFE